VTIADMRSKKIGVSAPGSSTTWLVTNADIGRHLAVTLTETLLPFVGAVVGEYLGSSQGVGYPMLQAEGTFDINTVVAGILVLTGFALRLDALVGRIERRPMKWQPRASETEKL
jgi:hypothetical protein